MKLYQCSITRDSTVFMLASPNNVISVLREGSFPDIMSDSILTLFWCYNYKRVVYQILCLTFQHSSTVICHWDHILIEVLQPGVYSVFATGRKIKKHIDPETVYVHMYTLKSRTTIGALMIFATCWLLDKPLDNLSSPPQDST